MSMPKGHKFNHGYATSKGGMGYREIAEKCSAEGHKMNHATARNYFLRAMEKLAQPICEIFPGRDISEVAKDPRFQQAVADLIEEGKTDAGITIL